MDTSPALFATLAVVDQCGLTEGSGEFDGLRDSIRREVVKSVNTSGTARAALDQACVFVREHQAVDRSRDLAQYVSLALNLDGPPFRTKGKEADLPPDASNVLGFVSFLQRVYDDAALEQLWRRAIPNYEARLQQLHEPLSKKLFATDLYLKLPISSYRGREFVIYVDPQIPTATVNARNYGVDYFMALSTAKMDAHLEEIRHTYLHYVLDPLLMKRATTLKRLEPIMHEVTTAPMDDSYKRDTSLLVTESLIRAIEARMYTQSGLEAKSLEAKRTQQAKASMEEGFVLTQYFYDALTGFEKETTGIQNAMADMLFAIDVERERKRAAAVTFASSRGTGEVVAKSAPREGKLDLAEQKLAANDVAAARQLAQQVLNEKTPGEDPARAMFVLARAAVLSKEKDEAQAMFERTLEIAKDPRLLAWSHISLGRIFDIECLRPQATQHYKAALEVKDVSAEAKSAAEQGLKTNNACKDRE